MVSDIQGYCLGLLTICTDFSLHHTLGSASPSLPHGQNLKLQGIKSFFSRHRCNLMCCAMGLSDPKTIGRKLNLRLSPQQSMPSTAVPTPLSRYDEYTRWHLYGCAFCGHPFLRKLEWQHKFSEHREQCCWHCEATIQAELGSCGGGSHVAMSCRTLHYDSRCCADQ